MKYYPETITVTITNEDRLKAKYFTNNCGCLLATALKRLGFKNPNIGIDEMYFLLPKFGIVSYRISPEFSPPRNSTHPYYPKQVVGMKVTLTKIQSE